MAMLKHPEKIIFEYSRPGRGAFAQWPSEREHPNAIASDIPEKSAPQAARDAARAQRARSGAPLHAALAAQFLHRHALLSARVVHDEVQPEGV
jgi:hypothetical protein